MTLTPAHIGLLGGAALGLLNFGILRSLAARLEGKTPSSKPTPDQSRNAGLLRMVAWIDMIVLPALGYFIAPMVMQ